MAENSRFAVYLIPPYKISRRIERIHRILHKQFGLTAADRFQVHATLKGFFKTSAQLELLIEKLDDTFASQHPIQAQIGGVIRGEIGIMLDLSMIKGTENTELNQLREYIVQAVHPFIAPDCDFSEPDLKNPFWPHITLAFHDIHPTIFEPVLAYIQDANIPSEPFQVDSFHLLEFFSRDWQGAWWETLTWCTHNVWTV